MKKLFPVILLYLFFASISFAQPFKFGWLTDLHIGYPKASDDLKTIISDINNRKDFDFVIITGDITEKGKNTEFIQAKEILDSIKVKYYIIPGNHDTKWSESACSKFNEFWKDDKFEFDWKGIKFIGLNSAIPWRGYSGHIKPEDLTWLDKVLSKTDSSKGIILCIHHPLNEDIDNWFEITNRLKNKNVAAVLVGHGHSNKLLDFNGIPGVMSRLARSKGKSWGYTQVEIDKDSLWFSEIDKDSIPKLWGVIDKINTREVPKIDSLQFINYNSQLLWQKDLQRSYIASPLIREDKIYVVSQSGIVTCFDLNGKVIWEYDSFAPVFSRPVIYNNILAVGNIRGDLTILNATTGEQIQTIGLNEGITSQLLTIEYQGKKLLMTGQKPKTVIIIGTSSGKVLCYDLNSLEPIWENKNAGGMIETKPLYIDNKIIYGCWDGFLYCIDARSGVMLWRWTIDRNFINSPASCTPVSDGKNVYVTAPDKFVSAIDLLLGKTVWRKNNFNSFETIGISSDKENLLIKSSKDKFIIVSAKNGKLIKEINVGYGEDLFPYSLSNENGVVVFGTKEGIVYLIDKNYNAKPLLFTGTCGLLSIQNIKDNIYAALNMDGKLAVFKINE